MNILRDAWREFIGLFVDDDFLAISIVVVVTLAAILAFGFDAPRTIVGGVIVVGCFGALIESARRGARSK
jgi:hypothetical protein